MGLLLMPPRFLAVEAEPLVCLVAMTRWVVETKAP